MSIFHPRKYLLLLALFLSMFSLSSFAASTCSIFIHGYTSQPEGYFGDLPRQVVWDSNQDIEDSAPEVASGILKHMESCQEKDLIVLRPHSYGASQVFYILGLGRRFQDKFPDHDFVQVYKRTFQVYSYTGAYHGTPLMDIVCSNRLTRGMAKKFGKFCVKTLLSSKLNGVSSYVSTPGVPTHLIYSSNKGRGFYKISGGIISKFFVNFFDYIFKGVRNQNDGTLPVSSARACARPQLLREGNLDCKKIDSNFFIDEWHETKRNHTGFVRDKDFMLRGSVGEK